MQAYGQENLGACCVVALETNGFYDAKVLQALHI